MTLLTPSLSPPITVSPLPVMQLHAVQLEPILTFSVYNTHTHYTSYVCMQQSKQTVVKIAS